MARPYACDAFVTTPALEAWRGTSVDAPPDLVWPWVAQIRLAPYSYDWVDNLGRRSPRTLLGLDEPVVGETFTACAGRPVGRVVAADPGRSLTGFILGAYMTLRRGARDGRVDAAAAEDRHGDVPAGRSCRDPG